MEQVVRLRWNQTRMEKPDGATRWARGLTRAESVRIVW